MKTVVTWESIQNNAKDIVKAAQREFGTKRLLSLSDSTLEYKVHPWIDRYIRENYLLSGSPSKADLDDFIAIEIRNGE